jgi:ATPases with chaperone activity, ATP-binding subunit
MAREEAEKHQNDYLGTEHIVLALVGDQDGVPVAVLKRMGLTPDQIRMEIERNLLNGTATLTFGELPLDSEGEESHRVCRR